mmetsp:Transcript_20888/g.33672  ORF Transcript_20888/g.33672 Transcript_20888/m.33672 type:complete len:325 (+) Transcript_20888:79-1053(+)
MKKRRKTGRRRDYYIGSTGAKSVAKDLADGPDQITVIQRKNGLEIEDLTPMLEFLDSMGVGRGSVYSHILDRLMEKILKRIPSLSADEREKLLANSLPYAHVYELRPIVHKALSLMKQQRMPDQLVSQFPRKFKGQDLYLPDWAKYQVWEQNRDYGLRQLREVVVRYTRSFERELRRGIKTKTRTSKNIAGGISGAGKSHSSSSSSSSSSSDETCRFTMAPSFIGSSTADTGTGHVPLITPACMATPIVTASSGSTRVSNSLPPKCSDISSRTLGTRVEPPTRTIESISGLVTEAISKAASTGTRTFLNNSLLTSSNSSRVMIS